MNADVPRRFEERFDQESPDFSDGDDRRETWRCPARPFSWFLCRSWHPKRSLFPQWPSCRTLKTNSVSALAYFGKSCFLVFQNVDDQCFDCRVVGLAVDRDIKFLLGPNEAKGSFLVVEAAVLDC